MLNPTFLLSRQLRLPFLKKSLLAASFFSVSLLTFSPTAFSQGSVENGEKVFKQCASCHKIGENASNAFGPVLNGIVGRQAGSYEGYNYSASLKKAGEEGLVWDKDQLFNWLENPGAFIKSHLGDDTASVKMPVRFADAQTRLDVIAFLEQQKAVDVQEMNMTHGDTPFDEEMMEDAEMSEESHPADGLETVTQTLVAPPQLPEHTLVAEGEPKLVKVELVVEEKEWELDGEGTKIIALTYNGSIPAPAIVVHQNDFVELTLKNPDTNVMEHNIDLHAVTGALGGAALTTLLPGEEVTMRFKATKAGAFLYHCAPEGAMTPYHVTHGMTGMIVVLPRDGLKDDKGEALSYDKAYYIGENDFYVPKDEDGNFKSYSAAGEDLNDWIESMKTLIPTHVVFNGKVGALTGQGAMTAKVGETVMFYHVSGNRDTRPHLIGGHGDYVWETGSFASPPLKDLETWLVRGGSAGAALYTFQQPGVYAYLNHNLIEAVLFGAAGHVVVEGEWNDELLKRMYQGPVR